MRHKVRLAWVVGWGLGLLPAAAGAANYGDGLYGQDVYSKAGAFALGPVVLPNTGPTWLALGGALLAAAGAGWWVWLRRRHKLRAGASETR